MPVRYHGQAQLLSDDDVERIYRRTDELDLDRDWVIVPLVCAEAGLEQVLPDGKILLRAPGVLGFEPWLEGLTSRLLELGISRCARRSAGDPTRHLSGTHGFRSVGTRGHLASQPDLQRIDLPRPPEVPQPGVPSPGAVRSWRRRAAPPAAVGAGDPA